MTQHRKQRVLRNLLGVGTVSGLIAFGAFAVAAAGYLDVGRTIGSIAIVIGVACVIGFLLVNIFMRAEGK